MAALPPLKQIRIEDVLKSDGGLDAERLVTSLNQFMLGVFTALDRGLTFTENFRCQVKTLQFRTKAAVDDTFPLYFKLENLQSVGGTWVLRAADRSTTAGEFVTGVTAHVLATGNGNAEIRYITGLSADTPYEVSLLVLP